MRFGQALGEITIPEWKECYINYQTLKIFVAIIKVIVQNIQKCDEAIKDYSRSQTLLPASDAVVQSQTSERGGVSPEVLGELQEIKKSLTNELAETNKQFYHIFFIQSEIVELFYQMKVLEIEDKYRVIFRLKNREFQEDRLELYLTYVQYAYVEISYLTEMREANLEAERKILKKHKKYAKKMAATPAPNHDKVTRMISIEEDYVNKIEDLYVEKNKHLQSKEAREFLRKAAHKEEASGKEYFFMGFGVGASLIVLGILIFIIQYKNLNVENNSVFARDFPVWRGIGIFILYIWVLAFDLYFFEKYKISHRLTFHFNDHHYSTSAEIFKLAGVYTTIFLAGFLIYLLAISEIFTIKGSFRSQHLAILVYSALAVYLFMPFPIFNHIGRLYALKLIGRSLISPIIGVEFTIVWMTDQWQSLTTPLRDLAYTICYYTRLDFDKPKQNACTKSSTFEVALLVIVIAVSYRVLQCLRLGWDNGWLCQSHMFNTIKYLLSLTSAVLAYFYKQNNDLLPIWLVISIISTLYAYLWDLKMDWGLLESNRKNFMLRKYLTFEPKRNYYFVIILNLLLRLAWTITLSPAIVGIFGDPNLVTFATGSAEIIRRGIWNLFRVQKEHLTNCMQFRAIPDLKEYQEKIEEGMVTETVIDVRNKQHAKNREIVKKEFIDLIKQKIESRQEEEKDLSQQYQDLKVAKIKKMGKRLKKLLEGSKKNR